MRGWRKVMPNGNPGDHPYTDIVIHGMEVFGDEIDDLVREIDRLAGSEAVLERTAKILWNHFWRQIKDPDELKSELLAIKEACIRYDDR
jgi:hypothetical protein